MEEKFKHVYKLKKRNPPKRKGRRYGKYEREIKASEVNKESKSRTKVEDWLGVEEMFYTIGRKETNQIVDREIYLV